MLRPTKPKKKERKPSIRLEDMHLYMHLSKEQRLEQIYQETFQGVYYDHGYGLWFRKQDMFKRKKIPVHRDESVAEVDDPGKYYTKEDIEELKKTMR